MNPITTGESIVEEITINASADRIFEALTDPNQRLAWWGGDYFTGTHMESDLRPGGRWLMRGTSWGKPFEMSGEYRTIERPSALAFTWTATWPADQPPSLVQFDLREQDGVTLVRVTHSGLTNEGAQAYRGWHEILGWLQTFAGGAAA